MSLIISLCIITLMIGSQWRIFEKAEELGWKALIPFYSGYILFKICWKTKYYWTIFISFMCYCVFNLFIIIYRFIQNSNKDYFEIRDDIIYKILTDIKLLFLLLTIFLILILSIILMVKLAKSFGKKCGFTLGLIFFPLIFEVILAFDSSKYIGKKLNVSTSSKKRHIKS